VNIVEEAAVYANRMHDEGRISDWTGKVFIYNSATDTGYLPAGSRWTHTHT
jgi:hypothetical protein